MFSDSTGKDDTIDGKDQEDARRDVGTVQSSLSTIWKKRSTQETTHRLNVSQRTFNWLWNRRSPWYDRRDRTRRSDRRCFCVVIIFIVNRSCASHELVAPSQHNCQKYKSQLSVTVCQTLTFLKTTNKTPLVTTMCRLQSTRVRTVTAHQANLMITWL